MAKENSYGADSITVLEGLEAVRTRPGMYIGSTGTRGVNHLLYEIIDNGVDEHLAGFCTEIFVCIHKDGSAEVKDNGRGIPVDMHKKGVSAERVIFTTLHAGGKFDHKSYQVSGGLHGVGSSVVNALSTYLDVQVFSGGKIYHDRYERGKPVVPLKNGLLPVSGKTKERGTCIRFLPDEEIFGKHVFQSSAIQNRLHETAYLNPGLILHFTDERERKEITFHEPEGLKGFVRDLNKGQETMGEIVYCEGKSEDIEVELCFQYTDSFTENLLGFCNSIETADGGTHLAGFRNRFTSLINAYARETGALKEKDENFTGTDVRSGMTGIVCVRHPDPVFEGQTKTKLGNSDAAKAVAAVAGEQLSLYFDRNTEELKTVLSCAGRSAKIRKAEVKSREHLLSKPRFSFDGNGKLANCESRDASRCEIFIVEGDSAGGSAKTARNRKYQAILPIRGKILNVEKASMDKVLANTEIRSMIHAFGCGFSEGCGNDFDITKLRYDKIIVMADADVDGSHIRTLLMTFFFRFMPDLIREGHLYLAMPPLYRVATSKERKYLYDDAEMEQYRKHHSRFEVQRYKGLGEMDPEQLWETTMDPERRLLKQVEIEDAGEADRMTSLLMGNAVEPRREYIQANASFAILDI